MELEVFYFLVLFFVSSSNFVVFALKYEHISDCFYRSRGNNYGDWNITFICAAGNHENHVFTEPKELKCSKHPVDDYIEPVMAGNDLVGMVNFQNCQFHEINRNYFDAFKFLHTFIISDVELETLQMKTFREAKNLTHLTATHNRLTEIPSLLFVYANKLTYVNFSNNTISRVNPLAFVGANKLETLDLSINKINQLDPSTLNTPNLLTLDLSRNNLTIIKDHTFDNITNLRNLNLSFNPIGNLKIETFAYLTNLENLNLKRTNITSIQLGTFSHQHKLTLLDLSENNLKELDFSHFMPILPDLHSFYLNGNQLTHLSGFTNDLFPKLTLIDIKNNHFNCSYLLNFMKTVNWENLRLPLDTDAVNPSSSSVRGINCEIAVEKPTAEKIKVTTDTNVTTENKNATQTKCATLAVQHEALEMIFNEITSKIHQQPINDIFFIKMLLVFVCLILSAFFSLFVILNKERINIKSYQPNVTQSPAEHTVAYSNHPEVLLIDKH